MSQFNRVAECLYRIHTGGYYALIKVRGKQIKRSLRTNDQALAKRRLKELREKATGLILDRKKVDFKTVAERWLALQKVDLKPASHKRRESTVKGLLPIFGREAGRTHHGATREEDRGRAGPACRDRWVTTATRSHHPYRPPRCNPRDRCGGT